MAYKLTDKFIITGLQLKLIQLGLDENEEAYRAVLKNRVEEGAKYMEAEE